MKAFIKEKIFTLFALLIGMMALSSCDGVSPNADEEAVLVYKPWFFGHGGVDMKAVESGLTWVAPTTQAVVFKIVPVRHEVAMDDLFSDDNTPLDFHTIIITQIKKGKSPILLQNYGEDWFNTNLYNYYCNLVRDYISQYSPFDLMSNRVILNEIDGKILAQMQDRIKELSKDKEFPVIIKQVTIGKASPNKEQLAEMNKTARAVQAKQTQEREVEVQLAREKAEKQRAIADKAYMTSMSLSAQEFIQLKWIETIAAKSGANIDVMVGDPQNAIWNIKR